MCNITAYWTCVRSGVMLHAALPWSLHLGITSPIFLISLSSSFTLPPYTLLVTSRSSSWPHPSPPGHRFVAVTWPLRSWCVQPFSLSTGLSAALGSHLLASPPSSQAVRDCLGLFGPGLRFVVENECAGAYAQHHLMSFGEWEVL
jgi:hypothetical protein